MSNVAAVQELLLCQRSTERLILDGVAAHSGIIEQYSVLTCFFFDALIKSES